MNWITILWSMIASSCLTLAAVQFVIWLKQPDKPAHLMYVLFALSIAGITVNEWMLLHASDVESYGIALRWIHVPVSLGAITCVFFIGLYFGTGRRWLGALVIAIRLVSLAMNFMVTPNLQFKQITHIEIVALPGGETAAVPHGVPNPLIRIEQFGLLLLVVYIVDASIGLWKKGGSDNHRRALLIGGSLAFFVFTGTINAIIVFGEVVSMPIVVSVPFMVVMVAIAYELSSDVARSATLKQQLQASEDDLRATQQRMALAADAAGLGIWTWDVASDYVWATERCRQLHGVVATDPLTSQQFLMRINEDDSPKVRAAMARSASDGSEFQVEYRLAPTVAEPMRWIESRGRMEKQTGNGPRMHGVSIDITARKQAEQELVSQRNDLAHLSRVTMLGELSGSLAHELNQPLTSILSNAQAAQRFLDQPTPNLGEVKEILADIVSEDRRAGEVIRRLRLLLTKGEVLNVEIEINELVLDVFKLIRSDLISQGVEVSMNLNPNLPQIFADRIQVQQVVLNLAVNACDAMASIPRSERRLSVQTRALDGGEVAVCVSDRGVGIPADQLDRVFEPFFTTKTSGMGLGLAVCRTIIHAHGGRLWASNNVDRGATFCFVLAAKKETHS